MFVFYSSLRAVTSLFFFKDATFLFDMRSWCYIISCKQSIEHHINPSDTNTMKSYAISTHARTHTEQADSLPALLAKIEAFPPLALPSLLGPSYRENGRDWYVQITTLKHGKAASMPKPFWIRIDGLGKIEVNKA
jgi:hypothetical protein